MRLKNILFAFAILVGVGAPIAAQATCAVNEYQNANSACLGPSNPLSASGPVTFRALTATDMPSGVFAIPSITGLLPSAVAGLSNSQSLSISTGWASNSTGMLPLNLASVASWYVANGDAANGYQGGTVLPASSTIHFFLCEGTSGTTTFANNSTTPTCPTGYASYYRRIFSLITNSTGTLLPGTADEVEGGAVQLFLSAYISDIQGTAIGASSALSALSVPTGIKVRYYGRLVNSSNSVPASVSSPDEPDNAVGSTASAAPSYMIVDEAGGTATGIFNSLITNTSGQLRFRASGSSATIYAYTFGWIDFRRN